MNDKIARMMANTKCPECRSKVKRDVHVPRHGGGKNVIVWRCVNPKGSVKNLNTGMTEPVAFREVIVIGLETI